MKERIKKIIEAKNLMPSSFADEVGINRPALSHILSGRNNPSLDALQHILTRYPEINADWLIMGKGIMYNSENFDGEMESSSLFSENTIKPGEDAESIKKTSYRDLKNDYSQPNNINNLLISSQNNAKIRVKKIAIFYEDNTYEEFYPAKKE